jgi:anti-sigma B factor antagonist
MNIRQRFEHGHAILSLQGNALCDPDVSAMKSIVQSHINAGIRNVVLDLRSVRYINSTGLGGLLHIRKALENVQGTMVLTDLHKNVNDILKRTSLDKIFRTYPTLSEALRR